MKIGVVIFPGANCDHDMLHVLSAVMGAEVFELWHKHTDLKGLTTDDCIIFPGGVSYGDYLRAGAIPRVSPIMRSVLDFADRGGCVFGICNENRNVIGMMPYPERASEAILAGRDGKLLFDSLIRAGSVAIVT